MNYSRDYEVLLHDTGHNGRMHASALCRYLQETVSHNMKEDGPAYETLLAQGYSFLLSRLHIEWHRPLAAYESITVHTWAHTPPRGAAFERYYRVYCGEEVVAEAATVWALLKVHTGELCRVGEVELHYREDEPLPLSARFRLPSVPLEPVGERAIRYSDVDINNHMNNTRYADMLCDFIPDIDTRRVTALSLHYATEAPLGETLSVHRAVTEEQGDTVYWFETRRSDGSVNVRARIATR